MSERHPDSAAVESRGVQFDLRVCVIPFSVADSGLQVLVRHAAPGGARLPSGNLELGEGLDDCAARIAERALTTAPDYLEQLYTFSVEAARVRVIVAYFALLSAETRSAIERNNGLLFRSVAGLPELPDEDRRMLDYATLRLRAKLGYSNIGFHLLPRLFTLSELQEVYESVIDRKLDKRNFRRRILATGIIEPVGAKRSTNHRPASLYRFAGHDPAIGALTPAAGDGSS
jgi:8-oxo-dGTP diphosphatase